VYEFGALPIITADVAASLLSDQKPATDWTPVLEGVPLIAHLSKRGLRKISAITDIRRVGAQTRIMKKGDRGDAFYVILDGSVWVDPPGIRLGPGHTFGELALLDDGPRTATVTAEEETSLLRLSQAKFIKLLRDEPSISIAMLRQLAARLRERS
jgi:CRP/FNR family transcriptional regulator, cyclic AMP receptor protein